MSSTGFLQVILESDDSVNRPGFVAVWSVAVAQCDACLVGEYASTSGASACNFCVEGFTSPAGSVSVAECYSSASNSSMRSRPSTSTKERLAREHMSSRHMQAVSTAESPRSVSSHLMPKVYSQAGHIKFQSFDSNQLVAPVSPTQTRKSSTIRRLQKKPQKNIKNNAHFKTDHYLDAFSTKPELLQFNSLRLPTASPHIAVGSGRHLMTSSSSISSSSSAPKALQAPQTLEHHTHWLCVGGMLNTTSMRYTNQNNKASYGSCVATDYHQLELAGIPSHASPAYAGVSMELIVLKKDAYSQTIAADSSSSLQIHSALEGRRINDASVGFLGSIFSGFEAGRAIFTIAVKPTFSNISSLEG